MQKMEFLLSRNYLQIIQFTTYGGIYRHNLAQ